tara:strand:- start:2197 stop:3135 length:939 start_codon:yes stop_codon:yes gene_type:complete
MKFSSILLITLLLIEINYSQDFQNDLTVISNSGVDIDLVYGMYPCATDGYDEGIDEHGFTFPGSWGVNFIDTVNFEIYFKMINTSSVNESKEFLLELYWGFESGMTIFWDNHLFQDIGQFIIEDYVWQDDSSGSLFSIDMASQDSVYLDNQDIFHLKIFVTAHPPSRSKTVESDWNLISLPFNVSDSDYLSLFPDAIPGTLYGYNDGYQNESELLPGKGYWLRFPNAGETTLTGEEFGSIALNLNSGWNIISGVSLPVAFSDILDPGSILIPDTFYSYTSGGYTSADSLQPGVGYWVRTSQTGEITISCQGE